MYGARSGHGGRNRLYRQRQLHTFFQLYDRYDSGGLAWEEFPKLFEQIFNSWLPASGFRLKSDLCIEVLHLWTDRELRRRNRYNEVWIPVEPKQQDGHEATESCLPFRHTGGTMASR